MNNHPRAGFHFARIARRALLLLALVATAFATAVAAEDSTAAIIQATRAFVKKQSPALKVTIKVEKVKGEYARALVSSKGQDNAWAYLQRKEGNWTMLSLGTGFGPDFYKRSHIPKELELSSAPMPIEPAARPAKITLNKSAGSLAIGVEPQGGRFAQVIGPLANPPGEYTFSTYAKHQDKSVLAIYATNQSRIPFESPAARVVLSGLEPGVTEQRIRVRMTKTSDRTLSVAAVDLKHRDRPLVVTQLSASDIQLARLQIPADPKAKKLSEIASGPETPKGSGPRQFIGFRRAGGMFTPVLTLGDGPQTGTAYFSTRNAGQLTADLELFTGDNSYIEHAKPFAHYLISGLTPGHRPRNIKLTLTAGPDGTVVPAAEEVKTGAPLPLQVEKYTPEAVKRLSYLAQRQEGPEENIPSRIPAVPAP